MRLTAKQIRDIQGKRPLTHELGGVFLVDHAGTVHGVEYLEGNKCRDDQGNLLTTVSNCSVSHPTGEYVFHTHPRANRPSSGDLYNAVVGYPRKNLIFTPSGVWSYKATKSLSDAFPLMTTTERRQLKKHWRFLGHMFQEDTQQNQVHSFVHLLEKEGFKIGFLPYHKLREDSEVFEF